MQCPKCSYDPTLSETLQSPGCCPSCGVYYSKVLSKTPGAEAQRADEAAPKHRQVTFSDWVHSNPSVKWVGALLVGLVIGYFAGREHVKYELRTAVAESLAGLSAMFGGDKKVAKSKEPAPKAIVKPSKISASLVHKDFLEGKYGQDQITIDFSFTNKSGADVRAFDGLLTFTDLLGNEIKLINIAINDSVQKDGVLSWSGGIKYNQFKDADVRLKDAALENIKLDFKLKKILYSDGRLEEF